MGQVFFLSRKTLKTELNPFTALSGALSSLSSDEDISYAKHEGDAAVPSFLSQWRALFLKPDTLGKGAAVLFLNYQLQELKEVCSWCRG